MSFGLISSQYGMDSENPLLNFYGGIGRAVLGQNGKYNFTRNWNRINTQTILLDVTWNELLLVAQNVPHLNTVLSQGAAMFSNAEIKHLDKNGEEIEDSPVLKLFYKPNPLQSLRGWLYDYYISNGIYNVGMEFMNFGRAANYRGADLPSYLWWLPCGNMKINRTNVLPYKQNKVEGIIKDYILSIGETMTFTPDEILLMTEGISSNGIVARTKIEALQLPLSNIMAALKSSNIIYTERGLIGFISSDNQKDSDGALPPDGEEMDRMQGQYQKDYSLDNGSGRGHVTFTKSSIKWIPMTFDMQQLLIAEGLEDAFAMICGAYGIHRSVFPLSHVTPKGLSAGTEIDAGLRWTYQNTMQPLLTKLLEHHAMQFGLFEKGEMLVGDYSHLPCLQKNEKEAAEGEKAEAEAQQVCAQTVINLNTAINAGTMTREGAIKILTYENDMDESDASVLIIEEPKEVQRTQPTIAVAA